MAILDFFPVDKPGYHDPKNPLLIQNEIPYILRAKEDHIIKVRFYGGRNFIKEIRFKGDILFCLLAMNTITLLPYKQII